MMFAIKTRTGISNSTSSTVAGILLPEEGTNTENLCSKSYGKRERDNAISTCNFGSVF